jgi:hypothetical protein
MPRSTLALVVAVAASLAGCASAPAAIPRASTAATPTASDDNMSAMPGMGASPAAGSPNGTPAMPGMFAIEYDGISPQGACTATGTPADQCQLVSSGKESFHVISYEGKPMHVRVAITYGALQPGFQMYGAVCVGKAGAKVNVNDCTDYKTAPSPMQLDVDLSSAPANASVGLSIGSVAGGVGAMVFGGDAFKVSGHLMASG